MADTGARWQVRLRNGWTDVGPEDQAFIESAWASNQLTLRYTARRQEFEVDFQRMCQRDFHGKERAVRRAFSTEADVAGTNISASTNAAVLEVAADAEYETGMRVQVREETCRRALGRLGLMACDIKAAEAELSRASPDAALREDLSKVLFYRDTSTGARRRAEDPRAILPRFEVLACPCCMEFGEDWVPVASSSTDARFWVHHVAALNIGESSRAADFSAYTTASGDLDEAAYLLDMQRVFTNLFEAQVRSGAQHSVIVPIGMGAFIRHLARNDPAYALPDCSKLLRLRIAMELATSAKRFAASLKFHICVTSGEEGSESLQNKEALLGAMTAVGLSTDQVYLCENVDATAVAMELARHMKQEASAAPNSIAPVSLANAANAKQLGNHWFSNGAARAIDENIHRRAPGLAAISLLLNASTSPKRRDPDELARRVVQFGGDVVALTTQTATVGV
jgi:hypothetical protein